MSCFLSTINPAARMAGNKISDLSFRVPTLFVGRGIWRCTETLPIESATSDYMNLSYARFLDSLCSLEMTGSQVILYGSRFAQVFADEKLVSQNQSAFICAICVRFTFYFCVSELVSGSLPIPFSRINFSMASISRGTAALRFS